MIAALPDRNTIHTALSLATRAPSMRESQPWLWRVSSDSLHLYADPGRCGGGTDAEDRDAVLSCGASLHHCVVALAALGWRTEVVRMPDVTEPDRLADLKFFRHPAGALDYVLAAAIPRRRSDWRPYSSWVVSAADLALIGARVARAGVTTRRVELFAELRHVVAQTVWRHASDCGHGNESAIRNGLSTSFAEIPHWNNLESDPQMPLVAPPFVDSTVAHTRCIEFAADNAVVLALGTKDDSRLARLRAGEATSLMLLSATALGLASCPVAEPLETAETREALRANLSEFVGYPQMFVRLGWPPVDAEPLPSAPRRPLTDVCEWLGHQSLSTA